MKPVFPITFTALLIILSQATLADAQYSSTPYPPACASQLPEELDPSDPNVALVWSGLLALESANRGEGPYVSIRYRQMNADIYRVGCSEPGRSVIVVELRMPDYWDANTGAYVYSPLFLPEFRGFAEDYTVPFELKPEPNARGQSLQQYLLTRTVVGDLTEGWDDATQYRWRYVLDLSPLGAGWADTSDYYNDYFLLAVDPGKRSPEINIAIPATADVLQASASLPLNGRLGGTWIEAGAADQGFLLTFGQAVPGAGTVVENPENSELHVFLSWFTFDAQGDSLWLVGDTRFAQGADSVSLALWQVSAAQFMGGWVESGAAYDPLVPAGELHLQANNCNALEVTYELEAVGLGSGEMILERLLAQEIAGFSCRDRQARLDSLAPPPAK